MRNLLLPFFLLLLSASSLSAQGICDSVISIAPIPPMCEGTGTAYLKPSHDWGTFSGPGVDESEHYHYLDAANLNAGTYTVKYTIKGPGGCLVSATKDFVVLDATEADVNVNNVIDCTNPNLSALIFGNAGPDFTSGQWRGPSWSNIMSNSPFMSTKIAGTYKFTAYPLNSIGCPAYGFVEVPFVNAPDTFSFKRCQDCSSGIYYKTIVNTPSNWRVIMTPPSGNSYFSLANNCFTITNLGLWAATLTNPQNGCASHASKTFLSFDNIHPSVNAGTDHSLACSTPYSYLNGGVAGGNDAMAGIVEPYWTTSNGHFLGTNKAWNPKIDEPGTYVLNALNVYSGCIGRDTTVVHPGLTPTSTQIAFICHGESLFGYSQAGNYVDTVIQANGCPKIRKLKLIVLAPLLDSVTVMADHGQMNGSIQYEVTQGWPPFVYAWSNGENTPSITNLIADTYTVTVTDANNCQHVREIVVPLNKPAPISKKASADRQEAPMLRAKIYPNPVTAGMVECHLEINSNTAGEAVLLLNDVLGRSLIDRKLAIQQGKSELILSEYLPEGVYHICLKGDTGILEIAKLLVVAAE